MQIFKKTECIPKFIWKNKQIFQDSQENLVKEKNKEAFATATIMNLKQPKNSAPG